MHVVSIQGKVSRLAQSKKDGYILASVTIREKSDQDTFYWHTTYKGPLAKKILETVEVGDEVDLEGSINIDPHTKIDSKKIYHLYITNALCLDDVTKQISISPDTVEEEEENNTDNANDDEQFPF